jgi:hypothetical protein
MKAIFRSISSLELSINFREGWERWGDGEMGEMGRMGRMGEMFNVPTEVVSSPVQRPD